MKKSAFGKLDWNDIKKSFIMLFLGSIATALIPILESKGLPNLKDLGGIIAGGISTALVYLLKNWLSNSEDKILTPENGEK